MDGKSQKQQIIELLSDFSVHCFSHELFMKDDRSRISELRKAHYVFDETIGDCQDKTHRHAANLKLRKLLFAPQDYVKPILKSKKEIESTPWYLQEAYQKIKTPQQLGISFNP